MLLLILQRYYFESESQRITETEYNLLCCCLSYKDTILKANHSFDTQQDTSLQCCCLSYKDTILKANHSIILTHNLITLLLLILQRYYFESESQLR